MLWILDYKGSTGQPSSISRTWPLFRRKKESSTIASITSVSAGTSCARSSPPWYCGEAKG